MTKVSQSSPLHKAADHFLGGKMLGCNLAGGSAVARVIAFNRIHCFKKVLHAAKSKQTLPCGKELAKAGFLGDYRPARGQIAGAAITEPSRCGANILIACYGE